MTEDMTRYLTDEVGISEEAARLRLRDEDLWMLHPDQRFDEELQGEEGVRMWEDAVTLAQAAANAVSNGPGTIQANPAITQLVWDVAERAEEALRRTRERAKERESSERDEHGLSPDEDKRLTHLIRWSDALNNARVMIEDHVPEGVRGSTLDWLEKLQEEAEQEYEHYRRELDLDRAGY